ncbi:hypothetical protein J1TS5_03220 [Paenibacillus macerans]|uniref:helix-turn-helix domain-containing protein n=1 Tax=Paenibacillus macerans TaxID=44252 RepID=UPI001B2C166D|nr:helix-turn-helix domain-containing protein [Paenibacillus macerans]GIP08152.1 hypothetical protein J1TS5_03220 [Paenibacillus macerans]
MVTNKEALPLVLVPSDIQNILGIGRRQTYELLKSPPFPVQRLGGKKMIKVPRDPFFRWLESENNSDL